MKYAFLFPALGALVLGLAYLALGSFAWLVAWPAIALFGVGWVYLTNIPRVFGKQNDGTLAPIQHFVWAPYLLLVRAVHAIQRKLGGEAPWHEVAPNLFVGRRPHHADLPKGCVLVVDMCAELPAATGVATAAMYRVFPTLDAMAPIVSDLSQAVDAVLAADGPVLIHCAVGRGRSATVAACVLLARKNHGTIEEAEADMRVHRAVIRLNNRQRAAARAFLATL